jgi:hypothetical protein
MTDEGYWFVNWSGDVGTIADVNLLPPPSP